MSIRSWLNYFAESKFFVLSHLAFALTLVPCSVIWHRQKLPSPALSEPQHLIKQSNQGIQVLATDDAEPAAVRLLVAVEQPEGAVFPAGLCVPAGGVQPNAVGVQPSTTIIRRQ